MDEKGRVQVGLIAAKKLWFFLTTEIGKGGEYQINPSLTKEVRDALGISRRETLSNEIKNLSDLVHENKKLAEDPSTSEYEKIQARVLVRRNRQFRDNLQKELDRMKK